MAKACAYSCQHRLWRYAGVGEFGEFGNSLHCVVSLLETIDGGCFNDVARQLVP